MDKYSIIVTTDILTICCNIYLWIINLSENDEETKSIKLLIGTGVIIAISFLFWVNSRKSFLLAIFLFAMSYINLCIVHKNNFDGIQYNIIFALLTLYFVIWITVLFGKFYYDNNIIDVYVYSHQIRKINQKYQWFPAYDFHLSLIFFEIGIEKYFVAPERIALNDIHFVQFIFGIIIGGTIISGTFDFIKSIIFPEN